jgi:hypothetical protein
LDLPDAASTPLNNGRQARVPLGPQAAEDDLLPDRARLFSGLLVSDGMNSFEVFI